MFGGKPTHVNLIGILPPIKEALYNYGSLLFCSIAPPIPKSKGLLVEAAATQQDRDFQPGHNSIKQWSRGGEKRYVVLLYLLTWCWLCQHNFYCTYWTPEASVSTGFWFASSWVFTARFSQQCCGAQPLGKPSLPSASFQLQGIQGLPAASRKGALALWEPHCHPVPSSWWAMLRWVTSTWEISLPGVKGCVLRCSQYLKVFCFIQISLLWGSGDRLLLKTNWRVWVLCSEALSQKETQAGLSYSCSLHVAHQSFHYPQFFTFSLAPRAPAPDVHENFRSQLSNMRRKVTQSHSFQCTGKSSLFSLLRAIWGRFSEESQLWLTGKHQTWERSSMERWLTAREGDNTR